MKRSLTLFFFFFSLSILGPFELLAQSGGTGTVSGTVEDTNGVAIPYASVSLHRPSDSSMVDGMATREDGSFQIQAPAGEYYIHARFVSYRPRFIENVQVRSGKTTGVGNIALKERGKSTREVEIKGEKRRMEIDLDKRVFNVDKDLNTQGGNAQDVLNNTPSVNVDVEGNVSLRGSGGVRILINGRPSGMISNGNTDALKNIRGSMIEKVEVITNPSARYEAEGEVGIINIVLKDQDEGGWNGSFNLNTGWPHDHGGGFDMNYRKGLFNVFGSYGIDYDKTPGYGKSEQEFKDVEGDDEQFAYTSDRDRLRGGLSHNARLGTDLHFQEHHTLTLSGNMNLGDEVNETSIIYRDLDRNGDLIQRTDREQVETEDEQSFEGNLRYEWNFPDHKKHKWTVDGKFEKDRDHEHAEIDQTVRGEDQGMDQISDNVEDELNWMARTDYVHPFSEDGKWEAGLRSTNRVIDNDYYVEEKLDGQAWERLPRFSDQFIYNERVNAAYGILGEKFGDFSVQGGLRAEHTFIRTELDANGGTNTQEYLNLFPSAHVGYDLPSENTVQLSYSRRIDRPHFWDLIPFFNYSDPRSFRSGNPELRPEFTNSYELAYLKYWKKATLNSSLYYRHSTDVEEDITVVDSAGFTRNFPVNMATENSYGLEINGTYRITSDWDVNADLNFYRAIREGEYQGQELYSDALTMRGRLSSQAKFGQGWEGQLTYFYRAPRQTTQGRRLSVQSLNLNIAKRILDEKGRITLGVRDLFNTRVRRSIVDTEDYHSESEFQWRSRQFRLTFSYQFKRDERGKPGAGQRGEGAEGGEGGMD